jgi:uncharacterized protein
VKSEPEPTVADASDEAGVTGAVVVFLEHHGLKTYAVKRSPTAIVVSLPNEPESAVERHVSELQGRLREIPLQHRHEVVDFVSRDPRDHHTIVIEIKPRAQDRPVTEQIVEVLRREEPELRRRGLSRVVLFGSSATGKPYPGDVDLAIRFRDDFRPSAFDIGGIQAYLEDRLGRRVDLSTESTLPNDFRERIERTGIPIFGS